MRPPSGWPTCTALALVVAGLVVLKTATQDPPLPPDSREPVLSADGSTVTFLTFESLVSGDRNGTLDLYAKRLATGEVTLVSAGGKRRFDPFPFGVWQRTRKGSAGWWAPSIRHAMYRAAVSGDGRYVAFTATDSRLVPGDTNGVMDVFVRDLHTRTLVRASTAADGSEAAGASGGTLALSRDGRKLAFLSLAGSLVPGDTNGRADAFVKDLVTGAALTRASTAAGGRQLRHGAVLTASRDPAGLPAATYSGDLSLSADGDRVSWSGRGGRVKVISDGQLVDVAKAPDPSYRERLVDAAVPDPVSLEPVWQLFPWAG